MEKYMVTAVSLEKNLETSLIIESDEVNMGDFVLTAHIGGVAVSSRSYFYFQAFQKIRDSLLQKGYGLKCFGARLNAVQSPMQSGTDNVYMVTLGKQALHKDLKSIYDYTDIIEFPNTKEQNDFRDKWVKSL